jgi:uroporphyrinogen decarboxylase
VVAEPFRQRSDLDRLPQLSVADVPYIYEAVRLLVAELGSTPLIGFAGAPFTLASYLIEGGPSRTHERTKALMYGDPQLWHDLLDRLADIAGAFLRVQALAGASAVQLFDSWAGGLSRADYVRYVMPHSAEVFAAVADLGVPRVHFGLGTGGLLSALAAAGPDVLGVDHRTDLAEAIDDLGGDMPVQGNIDPALLFAGERALVGHVDAVLAAGAVAPGHAVNLGHGVPPETDPGVLTALVEYVHAQQDPDA